MYISPTLHYSNINFYSFRIGGKVSFLRTELQYRVASSLVIPACRDHVCTVQVTDFICARIILYFTCSVDTGISGMLSVHAYRITVLYESPKGVTK